MIPAERFAAGFETALLGSSRRWAWKDGGQLPLPRTRFPVSEVRLHSRALGKLAIP